MLWLWHFSSNYSIHWNVNKHTSARKGKKNELKKPQQTELFFFFLFLGLLERKTINWWQRPGWWMWVFCFFFKKKNNRNGPKQQPPHWLFSKKMPCCSIHWRNVAVCIYVRECILNLLFVYLFKFLKNKQQREQARLKYVACKYVQTLFLFLFIVGWMMF